MIKSEIKDGIETVSCETAEEFLDYLQIRNPRWLPSNAISSPWIFRGQRDAKWDLMPAAMRRIGKKNKKTLEWFKPYHNEYKDDVNAYVSIIHENKADPLFKRKLEIYLQILSEIESVQDFVDLTNEVGHKIPEAQGDRLERSSTIRLIFENIKQGVFESPISIEYALAQHHGVPTRLIDFTRRPFVAAFFACQDQVINSKDFNTDIAVWSLNTALLAYLSFGAVSYVSSNGKRRRYHPEDISLYSPKREAIHYLHAQNGLFLYDRRANQRFLEYGEWQPINAIKDLFQPFFGDLFRKIVVPASEACEVLRLLSAEEVTGAHLMPTYDSVVDTLKLERKITSFQRNVRR